MPSLYRSRLQLVFAALASALLFGLGFLPLLGGPSYEGSLVAGLVLPSFAALATALQVARHAPQPFDAVGRGAAAGARLVLVWLLIASFHGLRRGFCDPTSGYVLMLVGPGVGTILGGVWGGIAGLLTMRWRRRWWLWAGLGALAGPLASAAVSGWRFYTSPIVFAYDPFVGFFSGSFYDTVIASDGLWSYRVGTLLTLIGVSVLTLHLRVEDHTLRWRWLGRPGVLVTGLLAGLMSGALGLYWGHDLDHYHDARSIQERLGAEVTRGRCRVVYSRSLKLRDAVLFAEECEGHLTQLERFFELERTGPVTAYLFESGEQKRQLMGASRVYIAKPWRREVYLQASGFPHPVLGHELAHVVVGDFAEGPFLVAGSFGGWLPNPGLIEGIAVAAAPREDSDLTLQQWALTLRELDLLPPLTRIFQLGFLGENSSKAYALAGAFVEWFRDQHGVAALKRWYGGATIEEVSGGKSLTQLDEQWRKSLDDVSISPAAKLVAEARFDRPALFGRRCPHEVDASFRRAQGDLSRGDLEGARSSCAQVLELDSSHLGARTLLANIALGEGDTSQAEARLEAIARDERLNDALKARALEFLGDIALATDRPLEAWRRYEYVRDLVVYEHQLRTLDVKLDTADPLPRRAIVALLIGDLTEGQEWIIAASELGRWANERPEDGLPEYLLGRNLWGRGRLKDAALHLDLALSKDLSLPRVRSEALRNRLIVACALHQRDRARELLAQWLERPDLAPARVQGMKRFAERCLASVGGEANK